MCWNWEGSPRCYGLTTQVGLRLGGCMPHGMGNTVAPQHFIVPPPHAVREQGELQYSRPQAVSVQVQQSIIRGGSPTPHACTAPCAAQHAHNVLLLVAHQIQPVSSARRTSGRHVDGDVRPAARLLQLVPVSAGCRVTPVCVAAVPASGPLLAPPPLGVVGASLRTTAGC